MEKTRILLETRIQEVKNDCKGWAEVAAKAKDEAKDLQNLVEELRADIVEKETRLDHLQKRNDELSTLLNKAKEDMVVEFRASEQFIDLLDTNYTSSFQDFRMDAMENFPEVDFSSIKLNLGATSSLLQTSFEDVNIEDDATTQLVQDDPNVEDDPPFSESQILLSYFLFLSSFYFLFFIFIYFYEVRCFGLFELFKYILLVHNIQDKLQNSCLLGFIL